MKLAGKTALVIGGHGGIGSAIVAALTAEGAKVCIASIEVDLTICTVACPVVFFDIRDAASINTMVDQVLQHIGHIDIMVNSAGVIDTSLLVDVNVDTYHNLFDVNVFGTVFSMQAVAKCMIAAGNGGNIINIASTAGRRGEINLSLYCASKAAVISLTQTAAFELIKHGIRVNSILPGIVDTAMLDSLIAKRSVTTDANDVVEQMQKHIPIGYVAQPTQIATCVTFLASDDSSYMVGESMVVSGGLYVG